MPLKDGYGIVIGSKKNYFRDDPDNFGRYYHGNLIVGTPTGSYHCAIDVDPKNMPDGVEWRVINVSAADMAPFKAMPDGLHLLASNSSSGALDYVRAPMLHPPSGIVFVRDGGIFARILECLRWNPPWKNGVGINALVDLEGVLQQAVRCYVFGEPFHTGLGVHNIHQNQGDPIGSPFAVENAIWQDGGTIVENAQGGFVAFLNKFKTQAYRTDDLGRPA